MQGIYPGAEQELREQVLDILYFSMPLFRVGGTGPSLFPDGPS